MTPSAPVEESPAARQALAFAGSLMDEGDYYRAIGEFKRYLFLAPYGEGAQAARLSIGRAYLKGDQPKAAAEHFQSMVLASPRDAEPALELGYARYLAGDAVAAVNQLLAWDAQFAATAPEGQRERARYLRAWGLISLGQYEEAAQRLASLSELPGQLSLVEATRQLAHLPQKSPVLAAVFSIVPGGGHLYLEQPGIALAAFGWNALFGFALYDAARRGDLGVALVLGVFEALWYFGTMFGAVSGAHKYNRDVHLNARESLQARFDDRPLSWPPAPPLPPPPSP